MFSVALILLGLQVCFAADAQPEPVLIAAPVAVAVPTEAVVPAERVPKIAVREDPCALPKVVGPCRASMPRFYYSLESKKCEQFIYGGCQGNSNNFETIEACQQKCQKPVVPVEEDTCALPAVVGPCRAAFQRFFFNKKSGKCEQFIYGGCQGNSNNFETIEACQQKCAPAPVDVCKLPSVTGMCRAYFERYFYNSSTKKCEKFVYGGCGSNGNNFETEEACLAQCGKKVEKGDKKGSIRGKFPYLFDDLLTLNKKKPHDKHNSNRPNSNRRNSNRRNSNRSNSNRRNSNKQNSNKHNNRHNPYNE